MSQLSLTMFTSVKAKFRLQCLWLFLLFFVSLFSPSLQSYGYERSNMAPVILVPGVVGSQVEGKWRTEGQPKYCREASSGWELMWLNLKTAPGGRPLECWVFRYQLIYNRATHRSRNQNGVETRVLGEFGSVEPVEYLTRDPITQYGTGYFDEITKSLKNIGYSTETTLKAAAYDGRYSPPQQEEFGYFDDFTKLVEKMSIESQRKVAIVAHSMGGLVAAHFLVNKSQSWKDKYIDSFVPISTPWLGSPMSLEAFITGTNFGVPTFKKSTMRELVRTFQSSALLLPEEKAYKKTVLVEWPEKNKKYTAKDYKTLFKDIDYEDGSHMRKDVQHLFPISGKKLGVKVFCIWSSSVKTQHKMIVEGDIRNPSSVKYDDVDGDGTVPLDSLEYCRTFPKVTVKVIEGVNHLGIVSSSRALRYIKSVLAKPLPWYRQCVRWMNPCSCCF